MEKETNKTPRVTQKNLQFQDHVQIKEIPSRDPNENDEINTWNPNLNGTKVFTKPTKQRNVIIGFVVCGTILLLIIIGTVLGIVFSQKTTTVADQSLTYNQACTLNSNQCMSSQGLSCPNGFCSCSSPYSWNTNTKTCTLLTYNQICSTLHQCDTSLGLNCTNQICQCDNYHQWNVLNNTCVFIPNNTLNYGDKCAINSSQCNSTLELTCSGNCTCSNVKIWNGSFCICPNGTFLNSSNLCETLRLSGASCIGSYQCDSSRGLSCANLSNTCQCDSTKYWNTNDEYCRQRLNYSDACSLDSDCIPTLVCPTMPGVCNCPQYLPDYVCNCADNKYYDSNLQQCLNRSTLNGPCLASTNYTCLVSLVCNSGICNCPLGTTWHSANSTCM